MGLTQDDRGPQEEPMREPLVDLNVKPSQPSDPAAELKLRRKRLSDVESEGETAPPQPPAVRQRRRSLADSEAGHEQPPLPSESSPGPQRPRLVDIAATPEGQEQHPKLGRSRGTITQSFEDTAGLQNIVDTPHLVDITPGPAARDKATPAQSHVDPAKVEQLVAELRAKQNLSLALAGGLAAAVAGAIAWALITVATNFQIGWMAVGVGFLVGGAVRSLGRGIDKSFGYLGATLSVFGCLLGNLLSICAVVAGQQGLSLPAVIAHVGSHPAVIPAALIATFHPMDLLFYALAVYEGYRLSFRQVTEAEVTRVMTRN